LTGFISRGVSGPQIRDRLAFHQFPRLNQGIENLHVWIDAQCVLEPHGGITDLGASNRAATWAYAQTEAARQQRKLGRSVHVRRLRQSDGQDA
jgi:hypothetical protein